MEIRGAEIAPFYAGRIGRLAAALARAGREIVPMHLGQPTAGTPETAIAAARTALAGGPEGYFESHVLVERIVRYYQDTYGLELAPNRVILTCGASAALVAVFAALFESGDRVGIVRPGYPAYRNVLRGLGRVPVEIDVHHAPGLRLSARLIESVAGDLRGLVVASPANPTGALLDREGLAEIAGVCRSRGIGLIADEIYHGISFGSAAVCMLEVDDDAIVINSFSKLFRMPGWRLGWMIVPETLVERASAYVTNFFLAPPTISQFAALGAFESMADLERVVDGYRANRGRLLAGLAPLGIHAVTEPEGAFYVYADVSRFTQDSLGFCERLVTETGLALAPGIDFDPIHGRHYVRFSFAVSAAEIERALALLRVWTERFAQ